MKKAFATIASLFLLVSLITLNSCKGKDGEPGPKGDTGEKGDSGNSDNNYIEDGFISGTASGTTVDGKTYSYPISYTAYYRGQSFLDLTQNEIIISRSYVGDDFDDAFASITITGVSDLNDLSGATLGSCYFVFQKWMASDTLLNYYNRGTTSNSLTNLSYNSSTGVISGNISISKVADSESGAQSFTGSFSSKLITQTSRIAPAK